MGITAHVQVFTAKTSAEKTADGHGRTTYAASRLSGNTPKVLLQAGALFASDGSATTGYMGFGFAASPSEMAAYSLATKTAVSPTDTNHRVSSSSFLSGINSGGSLVHDGALYSIAVDQFTVDWLTTSASAWQFAGMVLGGDIEAKVTLHQCNATFAAQSFPHGLSDTPEVLIIKSRGATGAPDNTSTQCQASVGLWTNGGFYSHGVNSSTNKNPSVSKTFGSTSQHVLYYGTSGVVQRTMSIASVDAVDVNVVYPVTGNPIQAYVSILAIRSTTGTPLGAKVGTFDFSVNREMACPGIIPRWWYGLSGAGTTLDTETGHLRFGVHASDGTSDCSIVMTDEHNVSPSSGRRIQDSDEISVVSVTGASLGKGNLTFNEGVVTASETSTWNSAAAGGYLILGDTVPSSGYGYGYGYGYPGPYGG